MFTTCTHCKSRFRLNVAQLTAAQGQVRCGKCGEVFDAYEVLEGAAVAPQMPLQAEPEDSMPVEAPPPEAPEIVMSAAGDVMPEGELRQRRTPLQDVGAGLSAEQDAEREAPELPSISAVEDEPITTAPVLRATRKSKLPIEDMFASLPPHETESEPEPEPQHMSADGVEADAVKPVGEVESISAETAPNSYAHVDVLHAPAVPRPRRPAASAGLWTAIAVLALLLGAQLVDLDRASLSQNPVIGPSLKALYASLGHPINDPSSVSDWNVAGLNVTTDPDSNGALSITGSLANRADFVQPWPFLRVVLTDRFGETLRSRDFKPADYLANGQAASFLGPGLAASFRLDIVDPGADAVGFSLTPCLDTPAGRVCSTSVLEQD